MNSHVGMKIAFLAAVILCIACSNKEPNAEELLNNAQRNIVLHRDSLGPETWFEVEKNETLKICMDSKVRLWETSLASEILNASCLKIQVPTLIGVNSINVKFYDSDRAFKINLAVGMKYLDFKNEKVLLGYNNADPKRFASITGAYLVDKYPVTNCEIVQLMWDSIPTTIAFITPEQREWVNRKKASKRNEICDAHDSAAKMIFLFQAMMYANNRSIKEGLKPYYLFSDLPTNYDTFEKKNNEYHRKNKKEKNQSLDSILAKSLSRPPIYHQESRSTSRILSKGKYVIANHDFIGHGNNVSLVTVDYSSDGYRLPFYDEWMMLARGGDKKNYALWDDSTKNIEDVLKYAKFGTAKKEYDSEPVGQLLPNGYGLYDIFGLVWEHVVFEEKNPFSFLEGNASCLKGGDNKVRLYKKEDVVFSVNPVWTDIGFSYSKINSNAHELAGFRLVRNIGNNVKWSEVKSK